MKNLPQDRSTPFNRLKEEGAVQKNLRVLWAVFLLGMRIGYHLQGIEVILESNGSLDSWKMAFQLLAVVANLTRLFVELKKLLKQCRQ